jgi:pimeloyl-ACP methyl ester carboxylesterase
MTVVIGAIVVYGPLKALLERHLLTQAFQATIENLGKHGMLISLCAQLKAQPRTITILFSRMIVAQTMMKAAADSQVQLDSSTRDSLVLVLIDLIGGRAGAVKEVFGAALSVVWPLLGPGIRLATTAMRSDLTNGGSPVAGDIVAYQGHRGDRFRERILTEIQNAPTDEVVLLAHSLGGIACVDLLIEKKVNKVTHLITVGSQSPFLYEIDSLGSLRYGSPLPDHFPRNWLNVYDRHDILAYKADGVFPSSPHVFVQDVDVDGRVPFPQAHGAYWANGELWSAMEGFLKRP